MAELNYRIYIIIKNKENKKRLIASMQRMLEVQREADGRAVFCNLTENSARACS
jgi:hypothetical protein